jgi:hypothetical protein
MPDPRRPLGTSHERGALGHLVADVPHLLDVRLIGFTKKVPDTGPSGHHRGHDGLVESSRRGGQNEPLRHWHSNLLVTAPPEGGEGERVCRLDARATEAALRGSRRR